ncbi:chorismate mutase [Halobacillus litoralis]|uniref:chorismate mutase n=1 Tax=Halobacillus litoralis TaxID=45668 RepID=UPI001CD74304|nr:chorismate mutase [Halobacillus litoralis]MCA0970351.1 chorismate mutase [Halobacillus litoralis]
MIRGIRGATTVENNESEEMLSRSYDMMEDLIKQNGITPDQVVSVYFSVTDELDAVFPAKCLRQLEGWTHVPVMCMREIPVPGSLPYCIRVMVTVETARSQEEIEHIYHHQAKQLRPDLQK